MNSTLYKGFENITNEVLVRGIKTAIFVLFKINLNKVKRTIATLRRGEKGIIDKLPIDRIPLKLLEMGCLPGNEVELVQRAPLACPLYLKINGSHIAIRKETAELIEIDLI